MLELNINGTVYSFNFGFGFIREMDQKVVGKADQNGVRNNMGLQYTFARVVDLNPDAIIDVLDYGNKYAGEPRVTRAVLEEYLQSEYVDIETLSKELLDFFRKTNTTKGTMKTIDKILEMNEEQKAKIMAESK